MATYTVAPSQVSPVIDEIQSASQRITQMIETLKSDLNASLAEWQTPEAKVAYDQAQQKWDQASAQMPVLLGVMRDTLDGVINDYANAEKVGAGLFGH